MDKEYHFTIIDYCVQFRLYNKAIPNIRGSLPRDSEFKSDKPEDTMNEIDIIENLRL